MSCKHWTPIFICFISTFASSFLFRTKGIYLSDMIGHVIQAVRRASRTLDWHIVEDGRIVEYAKCCDGQCALNGVGDGEK